MRQQWHNREKSPLTRLDKIILAAIAVLILIIAGVPTYRSYRYRRETVLAGPEKSVSICISPDNNATRAAAGYLAGAIGKTLGKTPVIVTEKEEGCRYITIFTDDNLSLPYSVTLEEDGLQIRTPGGQACYGAVRAVAERWLREDCGLKRAGELRISRAMAARDLSLLPTEIPGQIRVLSQNLCYSDDGPGKTVVERAKRFFQLVEEYEPDLIGTQECSPQWRQILIDGLGDRYAFYGDSRDGPDTDSGEWDAILYRKDRFTRREGGTFWLSNTPDVPRSKFNYEGIYRICTWALLGDRETGKNILFSNTHFHYGGDGTMQGLRARQAESLLLYLRRRDNLLEQMPGFLTGDFNGGPEEGFHEQITAYYDDARTTAITDSSTVDYSYHSYETTQALLDYCFHSPGDITVLDYRILNDSYGGFVSDHYGILTTAVIN